MRSPFIPLALALVFGSALAPGRAAAKRPRPAAPPAAAKRVYDPVADAYKQEQQARLLYWVYTYRQTLVALKRGTIEPIRPYPRDPIIDALFERLSPPAQAYARKIQAYERHAMAQRPTSAVNRTAVLEGIRSILDSLREEQELLNAMPVHYPAGKKVIARKP
jgi:hypothetical protein